MALILTTTLLCGGGDIGCKKASASSTTDADRLVVHEWGTFTSFEGADGATMEGMQHESEALPSFVHSRLSAEASPLAVYGDPSRDVPVHHCRGKMETPVIYFHTKTARRVKVEVDYLGLLSQWYPNASKATPSFTDLDANAGQVQDLTAVKESSLTWELDLIPPSSGMAASAKKRMPAVGPESDWQKAREVDAAYVTASGGRGETDQYVFYRGLMRTVPHPRVIASPTKPSDVEVRNDGPTPLRSAFLLEMREGGDGRFVALGSVAPGAPVKATLDGAAYRAKKDVVADITQAMTNALVAEGLFADEARAMVRTWSEPWFSSNGTRVLYLVPRPTIDQILPMKITPALTASDDLVRVIVGRVEFMTHDKQLEVTRDVLAAGKAPSGNPEEARSRNQALMRVANLGRFAEPATRAVAATSTDPDMPAAASRVLGFVVRR